jgi:L,D-transpeptidase catalytic domain
MKGVLTGLLLFVAAAVAAVAAGVIWWSGATLTPDAHALARVRLQPLAGSLVSERVFDPAGKSIRVAVDHGQLVPQTLLRPGAAVRVDVVIRRPRWLGWLVGRSRRETLLVRTPVARVSDRWPTLAHGESLQVRFADPVDRVAVSGRGRQARTIAADGRRVVSLGAQNATGSIEVAAAARSWERFGNPVRVSWFPPSSQPTLVVSPAPGADVSPLAPIRLTFSRPVANVLGSERPRFAASVPGHWQPADSHTLLFTPGGLGYPLAADLRLELPRHVAVFADGKPHRTQRLAWAVAAGSLLRLHQLLAVEGYLPVGWHPASSPVAGSGAAQIDAALHPPDGSFTWRYPTTPPQLERLWRPTEVSEITRGAVMMFEHEHQLTVDGVAGPAVWHALLTDALAGKQHSGGYSYVYVHTRLPQLLTLWHDGHIVLTSPGNTGIASAPTQPGSYPVFEHIPVGTMSGTNPDGSHYHDTGIRWISYFHGGDALHSFNRASFGTPQSLGCVELPLADAARVWPYTPIGTLVTIEN